MRYKLFGASGLRVSELFLGAMTFGEHGGDADLRNYGPCSQSLLASASDARAWPG